ncbi:YcgL domain protein [Providencia alcalifaciens DSM 30120]|uniref:YcgL domain protein n=2 Tax=Providencia alcalifaciens TaxID=126385 RepID=B6XHY4_9GAMM|nr:YcgL domain protein [Providencia alcalifaciens DSM 30120]
MLISLDKREKLANADIERVRADLKDVGYYLQFPPPVEDLLSEYRELND